MAVFTQGLTEGLKKSKGGGGQYFYLKGDGDQATFVPLVSANNITTFLEHNIWRGAGGSKYFPCIAGTDEVCPGCEMGIPTRWRATMPVFIASENNPTEVRLYSFGKMLAKDLAAIAGMLNPSGDEKTDKFKGSHIVVRRSGKGLNTKYNSMPTTDRTEIPDDVEIPNVADLMPNTREAILATISDVKPESEQDADAPVGLSDIASTKF